MPGKTSPKVAPRASAPAATNGSTGTPGPKSHTGRSTLPSSPNTGGYGSGSANSTSKSLNGSIQSDLSAADDFDGDNINVVVRVRPLNEKELKAGDENAIQFPGDGGIWIDESKGDKQKPFTFNVVFEPEASQADVLDHSGIKRLIDMAIDGFSTTCFCYGQTGSGKTHTLTGPPYLFQREGKDRFNEDHGLVFRSFIYLFDELKARSEDATFVIKASYLEIYNEKVIDLLNPGPKRVNLTVRWNKKSRAFVVDNLFAIECAELEDLVGVLEEGLKNRAIGAHMMNEHSSRSHTILTVNIHSEEKVASEDNKGVFITRHGKINFVDLAGSEMTKKTKSEGKTMEEANNINKSLMVLGYCIAQLSSARRNDKGTHIPYRDSKLTKLLADSLAGNGVTLMITCVSPAKSNISESTNSLRYAARAKKIKTKPVVVMDPREALIVSLKREVGILYQENNHLRKLIELTDGSDSGGPQARALLGSSHANLPLDGRATPATVKKIDKARLTELDSSTLVDLIKDYMNENQELRRENQELYSVRDLMLRDQELVCRENERLLKRLEDLNAPPLTPGGPYNSHELMSMSFNGGSLPSTSGSRHRMAHGSAPDLTSSPVTNIWTNPINDVTTHASFSRGGGRARTMTAGEATTSKHFSSTDDYSTGKSLTPSRSSGSLVSTPSKDKPPHRLPPNINKELEKRKIGNSLTHIADSYRDKSHRSKNGSLNPRASADSEGSPDELFTVTNRKKPGHLRDNLATTKKNNNNNNNDSVDGKRSREANGDGKIKGPNSAPEERESKKGSIRKERAKRLRGQSQSRERAA